jgi:nitrate reductase gamma subunit
VIPLTVVTSWLLLLALCALGVTFAVLLARHLEAVDDRRTMTEWQRTLRALEPWEDE